MNVPGSIEPQSTGSCSSARPPAKERTKKWEMKKKKTQYIKEKLQAVKKKQTEKPLDGPQRFFPSDLFFKKCSFLLFYLLHD